MPNLARLVAKGAAGIAHSVVPSFTNPNNVAIATGVPPSINGICGNYYYDSALGAEVMMNDPAYLRCPTIFSAFAESGETVAVVTTKEKLRLLLGNNLNGLCFSVECAQETAANDVSVGEIVRGVGLPIPGIYDPEISIYCLQAGIWLLENLRPKLLYLSTTDFVQHKYQPGSAEAAKFYSQVDACLGKLDDLGAILAVTADHGMNDKVLPDGSPQLQFLESLLIDQGFRDVRVILPITDPYVVHHGALGSFATVYLPAEAKNHAAHFLRSLPGVELVLDRDEAAARFSLPPDRIGDLVVLGGRHATLGRTPAWHDLSAVGKGLRSHGGLHEQNVPFLMNRPLNAEYAERLHAGHANNFDLFDFAFNGRAE
jgi:phosphonoacetate hydrolase